MEPVDNFINQILKEYKEIIGKDYEKYKNHVYRVFEFCKLLDDDVNNYNKYAIAAAFHDIGIWTANTFDYLAPSIEQATAFLDYLGEESWEEEIGLMINWHHKRTAYQGLFEKTVETFRKADLIDVSLGFYRFDLPKEEVQAIFKAIPIEGFHLFLVGATIKNLFKNPTNPLPMFKK